MAVIDSRVIFVTTSPRTPEKMFPEIELLAKHFSGEKWNPNTQTQFMRVLRKENFFMGSGENDPAFSARDRINRGPKSLGFVSLSPTIQLTDAGSKLLTSKRKDEVLLRQMLKFQLPSPFHVPSKKAAKFHVRPFLELLRLIRTMGSLKFDELQLIGLQLTDYRNFDIIVKQINDFRREKALNKGNYKKFKREYATSQILKIYSSFIKKGKTKTRESKDKSLSNFVTTKLRNMRDYADACFRYLRATGLVEVSHVGKKLLKRVRMKWIGIMQFFYRQLAG